MTVELSPVVRVSFSGEEELPHAAADPGQEGYAAACDLGTTTQPLPAGEGRCLRAVELPTHPVFGDAYVEGMLFEL